MLANKKGGGSMKKSKKAFTLVEMIVSIALIAIVSIMLVSILVPAAKLQSTAEQRNMGVNNAAQPLELTAPNAVAGTSLSTTNPASINLGSVSCDGILYKSTDTKSNVSLYEFVPSP
jgi:prepilin-type N-terminal cleavage/methylation domain-containing protein